MDTTTCTTNSNEALVDKINRPDRNVMSFDHVTIIIQGCLEDVTVLILINDSCGHDGMRYAR